MEIRNRADSLPHTKIPAVPEIKARRSNEIFRGKAGTGHHIVVEDERFLCLFVHGLIEDFQPLITGKRSGRRSHCSEIIDDIRFDSLKLGLGYPEILRLNAEGHIFAPNAAIVALGHLSFQNAIIFFTDTVELIKMRGNVDNRLHFCEIGVLAHATNLQRDTGVKIVVEVTPKLKSRRFVLVQRKLIVDIPEHDRFCEEVVRHTADAVLVHVLIGDRLLCSTGDKLMPLLSHLLPVQHLFLPTGKDDADFTTVLSFGFYVCDYRLSFCRRSCFLSVQSRVPPFHRFLFGLQRRSSPFCKAGYQDAGTSFG